MGRQLSNRAPGSAPARGRLIGFPALEVSGAFQQPAIDVELEQERDIASEAVKHLNHSLAATQLS